MTLKECVDFVDAVEPNAYTEEQKTVWVGECEGQVYLDVLLKPETEVPALDYEEDKDKALFAPAPHDRIYRDYLQARIHFANGEYDRYQNAMAVFNAGWGDFVRWYARVYAPAERNA